MTANRVGASAEDALIARYFRPLATDPGAFGLIDDAAVLKSHGDDIVVTTDAIVENVHFFPDDPPETLARKALRVNLSDLAAKGAVPAGFVLSLALRQAEDTWLAPFARALGEEASAYACPLLGGDTDRTPGLVSISITAFGRVPAGAMVRRSGGKPGDRLFVSGTIGDATLGLDIRRGGSVAAALADRPVERDALVARYRVPQPRVALAAALRAHAHAAMDISDGLPGDLAKLCAASGVTARIEASSVPLSDAVRQALALGAASLETLIAGGDDYEILCAVPEGSCAAFITAAGAAQVPVSPIGILIAGDAPPAFVDAQGRPLVLPRLAYSHF